MYLIGKLNFSLAYPFFISTETTAKSVLNDFMLVLNRANIVRLVMCPKKRLNTPQTLNICDSIFYNEEYMSPFINFSASNLIIK